MPSYNVSHRQNREARGRYDPATKQITLVAGSILNIDPENQKITLNIAGAFGRYQEERDAGRIVINQDGLPQVVQDICDLSVSAAHVLAKGTIGLGFDLWIMDDGHPIRSLNGGNKEPHPRPIPGPCPNGEEDEDKDDDDQSEEDEAWLMDADRAIPSLEAPPPPPTDWDGNLPQGLPEDCLSLYRSPPLPDYLRINSHRILALGDQQLPQWKPGYDSFQEPVMQRLRCAFPEGRISRADVVALCESWQDPVLCLVAAMVWGGIKHRGMARGNHLASLLAMGEEALRSRMEAIRPLVRSGALERAFRDCSDENRLKFDGVRYAYFTKLFYFIGQQRPILHPAPLILDKWTSNAFLVLGRQACASPTWQEWFDTKPLCDGDPAKWKHLPNDHKYRLYVAWFNHWALELGTSAAQLEQFVFGWSRQGPGNVPWNPRNELIALGRTFFCPPPAP